MKIVDTHGTFDEVLAGSSEYVQAIARRLETKGEYEDLLDYLDEKYGIVG